MPYKHTGDSRLVTLTHSTTTIPYAGTSEREEQEERPKCYKWSKEDIALVNAMVANGWSVERARAFVSRTAKREELPFVTDPEKRPFHGGYTSDKPKDANTMKQKGEGTDGVLYTPRLISKRAQKAGDKKKDKGLGFTSAGIAIKPRRRLHCQFGHRVEGDNVYVVPVSGTQQCRECIRTRRRGWMAGRRAESVRSDAYRY